MKRWRRGVGWVRGRNGELCEDKSRKERFDAEVTEIGAQRSQRHYAKILFW